MSAERLVDKGAIAALLAAGWTLDAPAGALCKTFVFGDFVAAFGFMAQVALVAERLGHHPDWSNSYRKVAVRLTTHDAGGLTALDVTLAQRMDKIAAV